MQVVAFCTPSAPDWRWRVVNYAGDMVEESSLSFPSIETAVADGTRRLNEIGEEDLSSRSHPFRRATFARRR